jgi:hypothetical protein
LVASLVSVFVAGLVLTSAQLRVLRRPPPRRVAYVVAWILATLFLGAFRTLADYAVGNSGPGVAMRNLAWTAAVCAASLFVADAIARHTFARLLAMHCAVVLLISLLW